VEEGMAKENKLFSSFVVCETTRNQLKKMRPEMRLRFYDALFDFGIEGIEPDFEYMEDIIWTPMRDFILLSKQDDEQWHEKQRESGKQGGAPKGNNNARKQPPLEKQPVVLEQPPLEQTTGCFETTHNKREENGNGNTTNVSKSLTQMGGSFPSCRFFGCPSRLGREQRLASLNHDLIIPQKYTVPTVSSEI
jgi:hypothetical protein